MALRCIVCGDPDPDVDDGRCMDCISAGISRRERWAETRPEVKQARLRGSSNGAGDEAES